MCANHTKYTPEKHKNDKIYDFQFQINSENVQVLFNWSFEYKKVEFRLTQ